MPKSKIGWSYITRTNDALEKLFRVPDLSFYNRRNPLYPLSLIEVTDGRRHTLVTAPTGHQNFYNLQHNRLNHTCVCMNFIQNYITTFQIHHHCFKPFDSESNGSYLMRGQYFHRSSGSMMQYFLLYRLTVTGYIR